MRLLSKFLTVITGTFHIALFLVTAIVGILHDRLSRLLILSGRVHWTVSRW